MAPSEGNASASQHRRRSLIITYENLNASLFYGGLCAGLFASFQHWTLQKNSSSSWLLFLSSSVTPEVLVGGFWTSRWLLNYSFNVTTQKNFMSQNFDHPSLFQRIWKVCFFSSTSSWSLACCLICTFLSDPEKDRWTVGVFLPRKSPELLKNSRLPGFVLIRCLMSVEKMRGTSSGSLWGHQR